MYHQQFGVGFSCLTGHNHLSAMYLLVKRKTEAEICSFVSFRDISYSRIWTWLCASSCHRVGLIVISSSKIGYLVKIQPWLGADSGCRFSLT